MGGQDASSLLPAIILIVVFGSLMAPSSWFSQSSSPEPEEKEREHNEKEAKR